MPDRKPVQQLFDFDRAALVESPSAPPAQGQPKEATMSAIDRLADWLTDPRTRKPTTELAEEALYAARKALVERKNGYVQKAEDLLEALSLRNGKTSGDDIVPGPSPAGEDFQALVEELLDALAERLNARGRC
jgi:hypothetical protein